MSSYVLTLPANEDLLEILQYTLEKWNEEQVGIYASKLEKAFLQLAENPFKIGSKPAGSHPQGCRLFKVAHHVIVYRPEQNYLLVLRILHEAMDFPSQLETETFD